MPNLETTLKNFDPGHQRIVVEKWNLDIDEFDSKGIDTLVQFMLDENQIKIIIYDLPDYAQSALDDLKIHNGRIPWSIFKRHHGEIHEIGAGKRDREKISHAPTSPAETLWYLGLIGRAFLDTPEGLREFAYIPNDLLKKLPEPIITIKQSYGFPASLSNEIKTYSASDIILDHACSLLAILRKNSYLSVDHEFILDKDNQANDTPYFFKPIINKFIISLSKEINLLDSSNQPVSEAIRHFLESPRGVSLLHLTSAWLESNTINELKMAPELVCEGEWLNNPYRTRLKLIEHLKQVPSDTWWSLPSFIQSIKKHNPDFQRPAGDYDSWFIKDSMTGEYLRGFDHWDEVDGRLIRFMIEGPLHWLGLVHLADSPVTAFKMSAIAPSLLAGVAPDSLEEEKDELTIRSDGQIFIPRLTPRSVRYQVARFCKWIRLKDQIFVYQLTPDALSIAENQGIHPTKILNMLAKHSKGIPPNLVKAIQDWEKLGSAARVETAVILRTRTPEILQLIKQSRASRYLGDPLGPTTIIVKSGSQEIILKILTELGYLGEIT